MPRAKDPNRFELKYRVPLVRVPEFVAELGDYVHPDPHQTEAEGYPIHSVYFDSPGRTFFWEKIEGLKFRRKVRFRRYGESPDVFLEIKQRIDRTLQKRRVRWSLERMQETFLESGLADDVEPDDRIAAEIFYLFRQHDLRPTMGISYRRQAFLGAEDSDLRITFDHNVRFHAVEPDVRVLPDGEDYVMDPTEVILEVKFNHSVPLWLCKQVSRFDLQMIRLSKYCTAVDRAWHGGRLT